MLLHFHYNPILDLYITTSSDSAFGLSYTYTVYSDTFIEHVLLHFSFSCCTGAKEGTFNFQ
jgi:hypothetical protein